MAFSWMQRRHHDRQDSPPGKSVQGGHPAFRLRRSRTAENALCAKTDFTNALNVIWPVQSSTQKYSCFVFAEFVLIDLVPPRSRGAHRDRHERWVRDAMGAAGCSMLVMPTNNPAAHGQVARSRHPDADVNLVSMLRRRAGDGGQKAGAPRRTRSSR
jgi:hypothetical protein